MFQTGASSEATSLDLLPWQGDQGTFWQLPAGTQCVPRRPSDVGSDFIDLKFYGEPDPVSDHARQIRCTPGCANFTRQTHSKYKTLHSLQA